MEPLWRWSNLYAVPYIVSCLNYLRFSEKLQAEGRKGIKQEDIQPGSKYFDDPGFFLLLQVNP